MKNNNIKKIPRGYDAAGNKHSFINYVDSETQEKTTLELHDEWLYTEAERDRARKDGIKYGAALGAWAACATAYASIQVAEHWEDITDFAKSAKRKIVSKVKNFKEKHKNKNNEPNEE